jgi:hypothetical protein
LQVVDARGTEGQIDLVALGTQDVALPDVAFLEACKRVLGVVVGDVGNEHAPVGVGRELHVDADARQDLGDAAQNDGSRLDLVAFL